MVLESTKRKNAHAAQKAAERRTKLLEQARAKADSVKDEDFDDDEAALKRAQILSCTVEDISFSELVAIVHVQKSTEMALTVDIAEALFRAIDADNSGWIDLQELRDSLRDPDIVELLEEVNQPVLTSMIKKKVERKCLGGKQTADPVEESFMKIAMADGKFEKELGRPAINIKEFSKWLLGLREARLLYFKRTCLLSQKAFCGTGFDNTGKERYRCFPEHMPRGYISDFIHFCNNHHPFFQLLYTDDEHPFTENEKRVSFFCCTMTTFAGTGYVIVKDMAAGSDAFLQNFLYATLPTMAMQKLTYYLMACPCTNHDEAKSTDFVNWVLDSLELCGTGASGIAVIISFGFMAFSIWAFTQSDDVAQSIVLWFSSIAQSWVIWFFVQFATTFMPSRKVMHLTKWPRWFISTITFGAVTIGLWQVEKEEVLGIIRRKVEKDGPDSVLLSKDAADIMEMATQNHNNRVAPPFIVPVLDAPPEEMQEHREDEIRLAQEAKHERQYAKARAAAEREMAKRDTRAAALEADAVGTSERQKDFWYTG
jgi:hypothetical protein